MNKVTLVGLDGLPVPVSFKPSGKTRHGCSVTVGYAPLELDFEVDDSGRGTVALGDRRYRFFVRQHEGEIELWIDGQTLRVELFDDTARRAGAGAAVAHSDAITAPMPGTILEVRVTDGVSFEAHDPVIIMESMKMEMSLAVPHGGRVKKILCRVGQLVDRGTILAELEKAGEEEVATGDQA